MKYFKKHLQTDVTLIFHLFASLYSFGFAMNSYYYLYAHTSVWYNCVYLFQRDTFVQLLLHSAIRSPNPDHKALARTLLAERKARRVADPLGDRLQRGLEESSD